MPGAASADPRQLACEVLRRVRRDGAYANLALSATLGRAESRRGPLTTELVYGVLRNRRRLDAVIGRHSRRPIERINADVLDLMRVAAYQLLLLDRVPAHAAVDEAVRLAKGLLGPQVGGFVNAVLRRITREDWEAVVPARAGPQRLAVAHSLPDELAATLVAQIGLEQADILGHRLLERAMLSVRCNRCKTDPQRLRQRLIAEGAKTVERGRVASGALRVGGLEAPFRSASYLEGWWTAQDEAAQLVSELVDPRPGDTVIDACAGVGGKATDLAARLAGRGGEVIAVDSSRRKLQLLREHCQRLGVRCSVRQADLRQPRALEGIEADRVLVDAPCSGLGLLRRHPELKWRAEGGPGRGLAQLVELQREILITAAATLRAGGVLVYSVCTTTAEEGPAQAAWLLEQGLGLQPLPPGEGVLAELAARDGSMPGMMLWPHLDDTDGFFIARFRRSAGGR